MCRYIVSIKVDRSDKVINLSCLKSEVKKKREKESSMSVLSQPAEVKIECTGWRW